MDSCYTVLFKECQKYLYMFKSNIIFSNIFISGWLNAKINNPCVCSK